MIRVERDPVAPETEWERCKPWIEAALQYADGTHTIDDVLAEIVSENAILWPGARCACVTQIVIYPRKRYLTYWLAGGDLKELVETLLPIIEDFARAAKFDRITAPGRKGWLRVLSSKGYRPVWSICAKDLK